MIVADFVYKYDAGKMKAFYDSSGQRIKEEMLHEIPTYHLRPDWKAVLSESADSWLKRSTLQRPLSLDSQLRWFLRKLYSGESSPFDNNERKTRCPDWKQVLKKSRDNRLIKSTTTKPILTDLGKKFVEREKYDYPDGYQDPPQNVHLGPIGSGGNVVVDENIFEELEKNQRDILALDREANAIGYAAFQTDIKYMLVVKGVQDYADHDKDDIFREFACRASAEFLIDFLRHHLPVHKKQDEWNPLLPHGTVVARLETVTSIPYPSNQGTKNELSRQTVVDRFETISNIPYPSNQDSNKTYSYDVFISHAGEDKVAVAMPLALQLQTLGIKVWIDGFELTIGDSLRRSIDQGLAASRFGIVILSPDFFRKEWPKRELDSLAAREGDGEKIILPIWHKVTVDDVLQFSPTLADRWACSTEKGIENIAQEILRAIQKNRRVESSSS